MENRESGPYTYLKLIMIIKPCTPVKAKAIKKQKAFVISSSSGKLASSEALKEISQLLISNFKNRNGI